MSIDHQIYLGFAAEITKLAWPQVLQTLQNYGRAGWSGTAQMPMGWMANVRGHSLPLGAKSLMTGMTALQLPGALKAQDPTGQGRTRTERTTDLAGQTIGGTIGAGAGMKAVEHLGLHAAPAVNAAGQAIPFMQRGNLLGRFARGVGRHSLWMAPAMAGATVAGKLMSSPSRAARMQRLMQQRREAGAQDQDNSQPVPGLRGAGAESPIAQEGQQGQMR